ncbi:hypothetical protein [Pseudanabaena sp. SR411]|uniref:hypothetical protein n=1 Tax=Pseudanabaena sp. SR411 TaxID=1980935 RepID=UPI0011405F64|nr:hypothetical protein [Pseudanabaena sp. SR411]
MSKGSSDTERYSDRIYDQYPVHLEIYPLIYFCRLTDSHKHINNTVDVGQIKETNPSQVAQSPYS